MRTDQLGIGSSIKYDNSGYPNVTQTWRPELARDELKVNGVVYAEEIKEPVVGAGKIYYNQGFTKKPIRANGTDPSVGETLTLTYKSGYVFGFTNSPPLTSFVTNCPSNSSLDSAVTTAQTDATNAMSAISAGISTLNSRINVCNTIRKQRNEINLQIWGQRQLIGKMLEEIQEYENTKTTINNDSSILNIIND